MCFSEKNSYFNAILLTSAGIYSNKYKLLYVSIFFAVKEILQGLLYRFQGNDYILSLLSSLSWIHISFQPLFVNILLSHFAPDFKYWNLIFIVCFVFALYYITILKIFDIQNQESCKPRGRNDDFCHHINTGYMGEYHIGYRFHTDNTPSYLSWLPRQILMFVPALFTRARFITIFSMIFVTLIFYIYDYSRNIKGNPITNYQYAGEKAAIWCFLTVFIALFTFFESNIRSII
jgi:hypothetical protein